MSDKEKANKNVVRNKLYQVTKKIGFLERLQEAGDADLPVARELKRLRRETEENIAKDRLYQVTKKIGFLERLQEDGDIDLAITRELETLREEQSTLEEKLWGGYEPKSKRL